MPDLAYSAFLGLAAGLIPVYLGLAPFTLLKRLSPQRKDVIVNFSIGVLVFLFVDVTSQATTLAKRTVFGPILVILGFLAGLAGPGYVSHRKRTRASITSNASQDDLALLNAYMISMGIGLHNFGEGLALGAAYAAGQIALTIILLIGFALHNGTEGMGISGPILNSHIDLRELLILGFVAGFPTMLGSLVGSLTFSETVAPLFFAAASGALLYVVVELLRISRSPKTAFVGIAAGVIIMYLTDLLLSI
jgi:ZIP family zinc transporter